MTLTIADDDVDLKPSFGDDTIANRRWTTSTVVPRLELPEGDGGVTGR